MQRDNFLDLSSGYLLRGAIPLPYFHYWLPRVTTPNPRNFPSTVLFPGRKDLGVPRAPRTDRADQHRYRNLTNFLVSEFRFCTIARQVVYGPRVFVPNNIPYNELHAPRV